MQAHKVREIENEKVFERKMQKEAEAEAHLYGDKEKFMTSAYRKKLEAREEYEADLKRREAEEARNDVTKRGDLGHFYANLLDGRLAGNDGGGTGDTGGAAGGSGPAATEAPRARTGQAEAPPAAAAATADGSADSDDDGARKGEAPAAPSGGGQGLVHASLADSISQAVAAGFGRGSAHAAAVASAPAAPAPVPSHERRNDGDAVQSARERYLARKRAREEGGGGDA